MIGSNLLDSYAISVIMPDLDSISFALLIPFTVCFVLLFLVCCFADKMKQIMCLPSQLPPSYIVTNDHRRRRTNNRDAHHFRSLNSIEENRILIGRDRNISESSAESNDLNSYADVYSRVGVLPGFVLLSTPINNPNLVNSARNMRLQNSSSVVQMNNDLPRPGFVVVQR